MAEAIVVIRLIWSALIMFFLFVSITCIFLPYLCTSDITVKRKKRIELEKIFICLMPCQNSTNIVLRNYRGQEDSEVTCSICLGDFKDTPEKLLVQLDCSESHKFHFECFDGWIKK